MTKCEAYGKIMIQRWRKQLLAELPAIFSDKKKISEKAAEELEAELLPADRSAQGRAGVECRA